MANHNSLSDLAARINRQRRALSMSGSRALTRPVDAANDNGVFSPRRPLARADIVRLVAQIAGPISVRYLTERVYIIERQGAQSSATCLLT